MEENSKNAYSEVLEILKLVDDEEKLEALPMEMLEVLKSKANPEYKPQISKDVPLEEQNLQPETYSILSWIAVKYWNENLEEEQEETPIQEFTQSQEQNPEPIEELQQIDEKTPEIEEQQTCVSLVSYDNLKWYQKIKMKIINLFNRIFNKRNSADKINDKEEGITL